MEADLLIGTLVQVTKHDGETYRGVIRGYDMVHSKYNIGRRYMPGLFDRGGWWAFPAEVAVVEREAT